MAHRPGVLFLPLLLWGGGQKAKAVGTAAAAPRLTAIGTPWVLESNTRRQGIEGP